MPIPKNIEMEFSFSLKSLDKYLRKVRGTIATVDFQYDGIVIYIDDTEVENPRIGLCLYNMDKSFNLDLLLPINSKNTTTKSCSAYFNSIVRPTWDLVFFSKGDFERALRMAEKLIGEKSIIFKSAVCFPQLGNSRDGITGHANLIMMAHSDTFSPTPFPTVDYSFGKPFPPIYKDEALQIAFRLIEHNIVNNQWLINLISKVDSLQKKYSAYPAEKLLINKHQDIISPKRKPKAKRPTKTILASKKSLEKRKEENDTSLDILVASSPKSPIRLTAKTETEKKKGPKKKSKKHFKINNLGFTI